MHDISPLVISYGFLMAATFSLAIALIYGAVRNHFKQHKIRPVVYALAYVTASTGFMAGMRMMISYLRTHGQMDSYLEILNSAAWVWGNVNIAVAWVALFFTLVLYYPDSRRG